MKTKPLKFINNDGVVYVEARGLTNFEAIIRGISIYTFSDEPRKHKTRWLLADDAITIMEEHYSATGNKKYQRAVHFMKELQKSAKE